MPSVLVSGPAGAGKTALARELVESGEVDMSLDFQSLLAAVRLLVRQPDGRYAERTAGDVQLIPLVESMRAFALRQARERDLDVVVTNSDGDGERRAHLLALLGTGATERIVDPGRAVVVARLSDSITGTLSEQCASAIGRWYGRL